MFEVGRGTSGVPPSSCCSDCDMSERQNVTVRRIETERIEYFFIIYLTNNNIYYYEKNITDFNGIFNAIVCIHCKHIYL